MGTRGSSLQMLKQLLLAAACLAVAGAACPHGCSGHGECNALDLCKCHAGWGRPDCSLPTCVNDCNKKGTCISGNCFCHNGYTGEDCSIATCPVDCYNHGACKKGVCVCDDNGPGDSWHGPQCNRPKCYKDCGLHGKCNGNYTCECDKGWGGMTAWRGYRARMSVQMAIATTVPAGVKTAGWATTAASPHVRATARSTANVSV